MYDISGKTFEWNHDTQVTDTLKHIMEEQAVGGVIACQNVLDPYPLRRKNSVRWNDKFLTPPSVSRNSKHSCCLLNFASHVGLPQSILWQVVILQKVNFRAVTIGRTWGVLMHCSVDAALSKQVAVGVTVTPTARIPSQIKYSQVNNWCYFNFFIWLKKLGAWISFPSRKQRTANTRT